MNLKNRMMGLGVAMLAVAGSLGAQDVQRWDVGAGLVLGTDNLKEITNKSGFSGGAVDVGFNGLLAGTTIPFRISLGGNFFPGQEVVRHDPYEDGRYTQPLHQVDQNVKGSLSGYQLAGDLFINTGYQGLRIVSGLSVNKWKLKRSATFAQAADTWSVVAGAWHQNVGAIAAGTVNYDESISVKGYKLGGRFGLEYTVNKNWSVNALLQYTELGMDHYETKGINPSWLQFGAKYHF
jgi:hypothetical protein